MIQKFEPTAAPALFAGGEPAWQTLGRPIDQAASSSEAIRSAGLDWAVQPWPIQAIDPASWRTINDPEHVANVRVDTKAILGVVGKDYQVFQNTEAFDFLDAIVGEKLAMYETAGALRGGRRIWMLIRLPREYRAGREDLIRPYVLLVNSHDGSTALRMIATTIRVVCQNTLNLALAEAGDSGLVVRHYPSLSQRVAEARSKLGLLAARFERFGREIQALQAAVIRPRQREAYFSALVPPADSDREKKNRQAMLAKLQAALDVESNRLPGMAGTAWAAYNAVSLYADHGRSFRGSDERIRAESRLESIWFGSSHRLKQAAWRSALERAQLN